VAGGWSGAVLVSALFTSIGIFASSDAGAPIVAAFAAVVANLVVLLLPLLARLSDAPWIARAVARVDLIDKLRSSFLLGLFDSAYAAFFLVWTALFLFLAVRAVESRRWS
jgi:ABC-2 type transport system permease protein